RSREPEHRGDLLGRARPFRQVKQCMNLADRAVDAPLPAHVAPMQHEAFGGVGKLSYAFSNFCHNRNIGNRRKKVKCSSNAREPLGIAKDYATGPDQAPFAGSWHGSVTRRWGASTAQAARLWATLRATSTSRRRSRR